MKNSTPAVKLWIEILGKVDDVEGEPARDEHEENGDKSGAALAASRSFGPAASESSTGGACARCQAGDHTQVGRRGHQHRNSKLQHLQRISQLEMDFSSLV